MDMEGADAGERFYPGDGTEKQKGVTKPVPGPVEKGTSPGRARGACSWNELNHSAYLIRVLWRDLGRRDRVDCSGGSARVASAVFAIRV